MVMGMHQLSEKTEALVNALKGKLTDAKYNCDGSEMSVAYTQGVIDTYRACREALLELVD